MKLKIKTKKLLKSVVKIAKVAAPVVVGGVAGAAIAKGIAAANKAKEIKKASKDAGIFVSANAPKRDAQEIVQDAAPVMPESIAAPAPTAVNKFFLARWLDKIFGV